MLRGAHVVLASCARSGASGGIEDNSDSLALVMHKNFEK